MDYLLLRAHFNFNSPEPNYGLLELVTNEEGKLIRMNLVITEESLPAAEVDLSSRGGGFKNLLQNSEGNYRSQITKQELINWLTKEEAEQIIEDSKEGKQQAVNQLLADKLEGIINEPIEMSSYSELISIQKLHDYRPELFEELTEEADANEADAEEAETENLQSALKDNTPAGTGLEQEIKVNCDPLISPVAGVEVNQLEVGDRIVATVNAQSEQGREVKRLITYQEEKTKGKIVEKTYKSDVGRYELIIELRNNIYGKLVVGEGVKIKTDADSTAEEKQAKAREKEGNWGRRLLAVVVGLVIIAVILGILLY